MTLLYIISMESLKPVPSSRKIREDRLNKCYQLIQQIIFESDSSAISANIIYESIVDAVGTVQLNYLNTALYHRHLENKLRSSKSRTAPFHGEDSWCNSGTECQYK